MLIYILRHGETEGNIKKLYYGKTDLPLTQNGIVQINALQKPLSQISYSKIYTSPLTRAKQTAEIINVHNKEIITVDGLSEMDFGDWENLDHAHLSKNDIYYQKWLTDWVNIPVPNGLSFKEFHSIVIETFNALIKKNTEDFVIVSHGGAIGLILTHILNLPMDSYFSFKVLNGTYSVIEYIDGHFTLVKLNAD